MTLLLVGVIRVNAARASGFYEAGKCAKLVRATL